MQQRAPLPLPPPDLLPSRWTPPLPALQAIPLAGARPSPLAGQEGAPELGQLEVVAGLGQGWERRRGQLWRVERSSPSPYQQP